MEIWLARIGLARVLTIAKRSCLILVPGLVAIGAATVHASPVEQASGALDPEGVRGRTVLGGGLNAPAVRRYWTPARMRTARPVGDPSADRRSPRRVPPIIPPQDLPAGFVPPTRPGDQAPVVVRTGRVQSQRRALTIPDIPFTRYEVTSTTSYPAKTHGKVFFSRGDQNFVCSGTVVSSEVKSVVFSAAHCLFEDGTWSTNWTFVPGYRNGSSPYSRFPARRLVALNGWLDGENRNYDIGAAVLTTSSDGRAIQSIVGSRGYAFNQPRQQHFQNWGYPAAPPFDGQKSWVCESDYGGDDPTPPSSGPPELTMGCDFTGGSSGGGWIIAGQYLNSLNQGSYSSSPNVELGPYFGDGAKNLYNGVCCGTPPPPPPDTTPPDTVLTHAPPHVTRSRSASFWFESTEAGSTFECRLGAQAWGACSSPKRYTFFGPGRRTFSVRARDAAGNVDVSPAVYKWRII